ncbi:hypothetical protein O181_001276 [Austropuccinia psidii MF-1]|uniref:Uncharacterized protein n=1 Tax=Austropuccinia psidii MF-1 TaxID=1389203 RepID=A0A9Q3GC92_9BASI|nr:hypothetical protein [Austropuccinia psidii MF-1]
MIVLMIRIKGDKHLPPINGWIKIIKKVKARNEVFCLDSINFTTTNNHPPQWVLQKFQPEPKSWSIGHIICLWQIVLFSSLRPLRHNTLSLAKYGPKPHLWPQAISWRHWLHWPIPHLTNPQDIILVFGPGGFSFFQRPMAPLATTRALGQTI